MKSLTFWVIGILVVFALMVFVCERAHPSEVERAEMPDTYTVQKGDTLSGIAQRFLGDWRRYKELAELNNLTIETINGMDYVWLKIGQHIRLRTKWKLHTETAEAILYDMLRERVGMFRHPEFSDTMLTSSIFKQIQDDISRMDLSTSYRFKQELRGAVELLLDMADHYEAWMIAENLHYAIAATLPPGHTAEEWANRTLLVMALIEIESGYRNVRGQHGELGWYQVKPGTWVYYTNKLAEMFYPDKGPRVFTENGSELMESSFPDATIWVGYLIRHLIETEGSIFQALERYNNGSEKSAYARKVERRYLLLSKKFNNHVKEHRHVQCGR